MLVTIFTLSLIGLNILFFVRKKYLYLFFPCMLFFPNYYGIDLHSSLPIITMTRVMYVILYIYTFINKKKKLTLKNCNISSIPIELFFFFSYFLLRIVSNFYYAFTDGAAINAIFSIVFEQLFLMIALYLLSPSKDEIIQIVKIIVFTASFMFAIGIYESITCTKPFDFLYTVSRSMLNEYYIRLGLLRATTTMGMPVIFGNVCLLIYPLILYLINITHKRYYLGIILLDIFAIIHSGSRADIFFFIFITILYCIGIIVSKDNFAIHLKNSIIIIVTFILIVGIARHSSIYLKYYYDTTFLSVLLEVGFDFDLNKNAPADIDEYGTNEATDSASLIVQLSGISRALSINPLFGQGAAALQKKDVLFKWNGKWLHWNAIDLGIVEIGIFEGLLGLIGYLFLFISWGIYLFKIYDKNISLSMIVIYILLPTYIISTFSTANIYKFLFTYIFITFSLTHNHFNN